MSDWEDVPPDDQPAPGLDPRLTRATDMDPRQARLPQLPQMTRDVAPSIPGLSLQMPPQMPPLGADVGPPVVGLGMPTPSAAAQVARAQLHAQEPPPFTVTDPSVPPQPDAPPADLSQAAINFVPQTAFAMLQGTGDMASGFGGAIRAAGAGYGDAASSFHQSLNTLAAKAAGVDIKDMGKQFPFNVMPQSFLPRNDIEPEPGNTFSTGQIAAATPPRDIFRQVADKPADLLDSAAQSIKVFARDHTPTRQVPSFDKVNDWRSGIVYGMESAAQGVGSTVPTLLAYAAMGPGAAAPLIYSQSIGQMREALDDAGVDDSRQRDAIMLAGGMIMGRVESMSHGALTDIFKEKLGQHIARRLVMAGGKGGATEGLEEVLQEATQIAGVAMAKGENVADALLSPAGIKQMTEAGLQGFIGGVAIGAGGRAATEAQQRFFSGQTKGIDPAAIGMTAISPVTEGDGKSAPLAAITVYHGTPHEFERFSNEKIGTGEGAQAFGHGLYFAENKDVAKTYDEGLSDWKFHADGKLIDGHDGQSAAYRLMRVADAEQVKPTEMMVEPALASWVKDTYGTTPDDPSVAIEAAKMRHELMALVGKKLALSTSGNTYTVTINAEPHDFLDWDAPWSSQPPSIRDAFARSGMPASVLAPTPEGEEPTGAAVYMRAATYLGDQELAKIDKPGIGPAQKRLDYGRNMEPAVSAALLSAGIKGIRYYDGMSRQSQDGTRNYVVFDPNILEITHKNGDPVASKTRDEVMQSVAPLAAIRAYHGSPHEFDRFDSTNIGSGEGAQAYGYGLYFAENKGVASHYAKTLAVNQNVTVDGKPVSQWASHFLIDAGFNVEKAIEVATKVVEQMKSSPSKVVRARLARENLEQAVTEIVAARGRTVALSTSRPQLYEVSIDVDPRQLLDWHKPLSKQSEEINVAVRRLSAKMGDDFSTNFSRPDHNGEDIWFGLTLKLSKRGGDLNAALNATFGGASPEASAALREAGIVGIRYLDAGSRGDGAGTNNIVIFPGEEHRIKIVAKNGRPVSGAEREQVLLAMRQGQRAADPDRATAFKKWRDAQKQTPSEIVPTRRTSVEIIKQRLDAGRTVDIPSEFVATINDMLTPVVGFLPSNGRAGVVSQIAPTDDSKTAALVLTEPSGETFRVVFPREMIFNSAAIYSGSTGSIAFIPFDAFDILAEVRRGGIDEVAAREKISDHITGTFLHEVTHLLSRSGAMSGPDWRRLVDHSNLLGVLDAPVRDYYRMTGAIDYNMAPANQTIKDAYGKLYSKAPTDAVSEAIDQEAAAILVESIHYGKLSEEDVAPIQDILDRYYNGLKGTPVEHYESQQWVDIGPEAQSATLSSLRGDGDKSRPSTWQRIRSYIGRRDETRNRLADAAPEEVAGSGQIVAGQRPGEVTADETGRDGRGGGQRSDEQAGFRLRGGYRGHVVQSVAPHTGLPRRDYYVYGSGGVPLSGQSSAAVSLKVMKSVSNWVARARLDQRGDGSWEMSGVSVRKNMRRRGVATRLLDAIDDSLGSPVLPTGNLTRQEYEFWKRRHPDVVSEYVPFDGRLYSIERLIALRDVYITIAATGTKSASALANNAVRRIEYALNKTLPSGVVPQKNDYLLSISPRAEEWMFDDVSDSAIDDVERDTWAAMSDASAASDILYGGEYTSKQSKRIDRSSVEVQSDALMDEVAAEERRLRSNGASPAEIAAGISDKFGFPVSAESVASGRVWWKIDDVLADEKSGRRTRRTQDRVEAVRKMRDAGLSAGAIASELSKQFNRDITATWVENTVRLNRDMGRRLKKYDYSPEENLTMARMYLSGADMESIGSKIGQGKKSNYDAITKQLSRLGLFGSRGAPGNSNPSVAIVSRMMDNEGSSYLSMSRVVSELTGQDVSSNAIAGLVYRINTQRMRERLARDLGVDVDNIALAKTPKSLNYNLSSLRSSPRKPPSIVSAIRSFGGIKDVDGELKQIFDRPGVKGYIPGIINNKTGMHPDKAREVLVQSGYLRDAREGDLSTSTANDLYDALRRTASGERVVAFGDIQTEMDADDQSEADHYAAEVLHEARGIATDAGIDGGLTEFEEERIVDLVYGGMSVEDALEAALIASVDNVLSPEVAGLTSTEMERFLELRQQGVGRNEAIDAAQQETFRRMEEDEARARSQGSPRSNAQVPGQQPGISYPANQIGNARQAGQAQAGLSVRPPPLPARPVAVGQGGGAGGPGGPRGPQGPRNPRGPAGPGGIPPPGPTINVTPNRGLGHYYRSAVNKLYGWYSPIDRLKGADKYRLIKYRALGSIDASSRATRKIWEAFKKASDADKKAAYAFLTTRGVSSAAIADPKVRQAADFSKQIIHAIGVSLVQRGMIPQASFDKYRDRYLPRVYLKHLIDRHGMIGGFAGGARPSKLGYTKRRRDLDKETRLLLGEITDPGFLAARGIFRTIRDMALMDALDEISQNDDWVFRDALMPYRGRVVSPFYLRAEAEELSYRALFEPDPASRTRMEAEAQAMHQASDPYIRPDERVPDGYKQVPDSPRYGMLRGMYVRKEIHNDLLPSVGLTPEDAPWVEKFFSPRGAGGKLTGWWKAMKVPMNPSTQARNVISNGIMLNMSGMSWPDIVTYMGKAIREIRANGPVYKQALKLGLKSSGFSEHELAKITAELLNAEMVNARQSWAFPIMYPALLAKSAFGTVTEWAGDKYQYFEGMMKLAKMMHEIERNKMSPDNAYLEAQKWLFDYSEVPKTVSFLRNFVFGVPFITYQYKALPRIIETAAHRPWKLAPYVALPYMFAQLVAHLFDVDKDDVDKLKEALPDWLRQKENMLVVPFKDEQGRWQFYDFGYLLPWSMFQESTTQLARGEVGDAMRTAGLATGPMADLVSVFKSGGIDPFTKRPIYDKRDPAGKQFTDILHYVNRSMMPPWITDQSFALKMIDAYRETPTRSGDPGLTLGQATLRAFGQNVYPIEPEVSRARNLREFDSEVLGLRARMRQRLKDKRLTDDQRTEISRQYNELIERKKQEKADYAERSAIHPKLSGEEKWTPLTPPFPAERWEDIKP